ncbi:hypothetical protein ACHAO9_010549 [Fusarium lateritium]
MDPVSAVGLASAILTFVEARLKLIKTAHGIHNSVEGILDENMHRESIACEVKQAATRLEITVAAGLTPEQQSLCNLAKKCRETSTELVAVLDKVKPKPGPSNPLKSFGYALKATKKANQIEDLQGCLKDYRDQLTLALVELSKVEAADEFKKMLSLVKDNDTKLESLTQDVEHLRQAHLSVTNSQAFSNFQQLLTVDSQARCAIYQERILNSLAFDEMHLRYQAVHIAHEDTFNWIYEPIDRDVSGDDHDYRASENILQMQAKSREDFITWLSSNAPLSPIFHISGKLGSGKSTLMKYLCSHPRTKEELSKWAGTRRLVLPSFFFWRNGTRAQKSLEGLCRSLIHHILKERPDLIPEVFPEEWSRMKQAPWVASNRLETPKLLIKNALKRLFQSPRLHDKHSFCIFIDGLDEFEPGIQDGLDYQDLIQLLRQWTLDAKENIKPCVSSREEGVFMDEYANDPSFRLQDLTRYDMQGYVRSRLNGLKNEELRDKFIDVIPRKSSGIFLWTYLVVKTIRNKISHRVSDKALERHLNTLPEDLKALFQHVLQSLEPDDRTWTLRIIALLQTAKAKNVQFSLLAASFLEEYDKDTEFCMRDSFAELQKDWEILRAQLRGACGGLIEYHTEFKDCPDTIEFVHRSVPDMFQKSMGSTELSLQMEHALGGTDTIDVLTHLCFAEFRTPQDDRYIESLKMKLKQLIYIRLSYMSDPPPYYFLEFINTWINSTWNNNALLDIPGLTWRFRVGPNPGLSTAITSYDDRVEEFVNTIMVATYIGRDDYIRWKLQNDPTVVYTPLKRALVGQNILWSKHWELYFSTDIFSLDVTVPLLPILAIVLGLRHTIQAYRLDVSRLWLHRGSH